jgi:hypothetical protein
MSSRRLWPVAAAAFVLSSTPSALAGPYRVAFVFQPAYTFCVSAGPSCSSSTGGSIGAEYKPVVNPKLNLRIKLARSYERTSEEPAIDDIAPNANQGRQAAEDALGLRLRLFDGDGYEHQEIKAGYAYEYPAGTSSSHHTYYASDELFAGRGIQRGSEGPARQFHVLLKLTKDTGVPAGTIAQTFVQLAAYATFPLDAAGDWRTQAGYTVQQQTAASGGTGALSTRLTTSLTHDLSPAVRAYFRVDVRPGATTATLGGKITL